MKNKKHKIVAEFRRDLVSNDWILISSLRQVKPHFLSKKGKIKKKISLKNCPFENPQKSGNPKPILWVPKPKRRDWFIQVIPNKYPLLLTKNKCARFDLAGIHQKVEALGFHEVVVMADHKKTIEKMSLEELILVFKIYRERYRALEKNKCVEYILIFHNQGELAGASIEHPHSQIAALPITPPDVNRSINGGLEYFEKHKKCVHCVMLKREIEDEKRIIFQNKYFITINPYASRVPYETRIFPLKHNSDFEKTPDDQLFFLAEALKDALIRIGKVLKNPDYNFFIHTSSANVENVPYYHWHIEILPRTYKWAGLELGTGIEVVTVSPEQAARELTKAKVRL
ncbi:MAG: DUF4921 family protein [Candidatus Terrybacteria bacterium]|nr:DUF4921 family protein [Candidatus Terrybacteria bacterium]